MSDFKYFKNIPQSPPHRATCPKCNFFFLQIRNEVPGKKKGPIAHPRGDRGLSPVGGATGSPPPYINPGRHMPLSPLSFEPENSTKNPEKKRGVRRREAAKLCRIQHL